MSNGRGRHAQRNMCVRRVVQSSNGGAVGFNRKVELGKKTVRLFESDISAMTH
jgi:hypothetical protein